MRGLDLLPVDADPKPGPLGYVQEAAFDLKRFQGQTLSLLPDPVRVDRRDLPGCRGRHVREHGERYVEVIVGMRTPGQTPGSAQLGNPHRAGQAPEMRV